MVRALLPLAAVALWAGISGPISGTAQAQEVKWRLAAMQRPASPTVEQAGASPDTSLPAVPVRPPEAATYAVWWVVMNNPGFCGGICGLDDLAAGDLGVTLFHAAGLGSGREVAEPPARAAAEEAPSESGDDTCLPAECTELQRVTFLPVD